MRWLFAILLTGACAAAQAPTAAGPIDLAVPARDATLAATLQFPTTGQAPYPAIVLAHGSGRVTRDHMRFWSGPLLAMGLAVLTYDKRGVGQSTGTYSNVGTANSIEMLNALADDALAGVAVLKARADIDPKRIGLGGGSQAGWITPLAASKSRDVAFLVITSGPAVSVGEEIAYSRLAGEDPGSIQGLTDDEIDRRMALFSGPHGYDPVPVLEKLETPSMWIEGESDRSVPMPKTLSTLERIQKTGRPIAIVRLPGANHALMNPSTGERPNFWPRIESWLREHGVFSR